MTYTGNFCPQTHGHEKAPLYLALAADLDTDQRATRLCGAALIAAQNTAPGPAINTQTTQREITKRDHEKLQMAKQAQ